MELEVHYPLENITLCGFTVRRAHPADLAGIIECSYEDPNVASFELFHRFFYAGHACYVIERGEKIFGYSWVFFNHYFISYDGYKRGKIQLHLPSRCIFIGNVFVGPAHRRRGLYSYMLNSIIRENCASRGISSVLVEIKTNNYVSLKVHNKLQFQIIFSLNYLGFYPLQFLVIVPNVGRFRIFPVNLLKTIEFEQLCK
jgi:GNAT superfamily N-acetyltransferase